MGFFNNLSKKHNYVRTHFHASSSYRFDVAIVCPAINPKLWGSLHQNFASNKLNFVLILIGHVRPSGPLPDNVVYIFSEMGPVPCGDIGYQYVFDNNLAPYIIWAADDQYFDGSFLDDLVRNYKSLKREYPNRVICVSPVSRARCGGCDCMGWPSDGQWGYHGVTIGANICLSIEDAKLLGGGDRRFMGLDSHIDRQLRVYSELGGIILILNESDCKSTREKEGYSQMSSKTGRHDRQLLGNLYPKENYQKLSGKEDGPFLEACYGVTKTPADDEIYFSKKTGPRNTPGTNGVNIFSKQRWVIKRRESPQLYSREELKFQEPDWTKKFSSD